MEHGQLILGPGLRGRHFPGGASIVRSKATATAFSGAWEVLLNGNGQATVAPGTVNRVDAKIKGVKLSRDPAPLLTFGKPRIDAEGRGWICAEVTCDPKQNWSVIGVEIVQVADPDTNDGSAGSGLNPIGGAAVLSGNRTRHPLALLRVRADGRIDVEQIAYFSLQHRVALRSDGRSAQRHFFWS